MDRADEIIAHARRYIGTPFIHQGRSPAGVDCIGLVLCVAGEMGVDLVDRSDYGRTPFRGLLETELKSQISEVPLTDLAPGDIMLLSWPGGQPSHVAIYTGRTMIHSYEKRGKVVEHRYIPGRPCRLTGVFRI